ncbi:MAG: AzlD domain-containing protein [Clostridia bacterium]|nr:AzlD domain-containing protein [Clostridia bacterium]
MNNNIFFIYLLILAGSTYLIRVIPFVAIKEKINNRFIRSFLYYIPYAVLTTMTIPAVFYATNWWVGAVAGLIVAIIFALKGKGLTTVAVAACTAVFIAELFH